jgi:hypothetical protein
MQSGDEEEMTCFTAGRTVEDGDNESLTDNICPSFTEKQ